MRKNKRKRNTRKSIPKMTKINKKVINITTAILIIIFLAVIFAVLNIGNSAILHGITINGLKVSGLTMDEAQDFIQETMQGTISEGIKMKHNDNEFTFELNELNIKYSASQAIQEAYKVGRSGNVVKDNFTILYMFLFKKDFKFDIGYDDSLLDRQIDYLEIQLPDRAVDNKYYVEDKDLIIVKGLNGVKINKDKTKDVILKHIYNLSKKDVSEEIPVEESKVASLDISKIHNEIYKEAQNAYYTVEPFEIHADVVGVDFAISNQEIESILSKDDMDYVIPLKYTKPQITTESLDINVFPDLIAQYDTKYDVTNTNRANNLIIASNKLNGITVEPGETFSYNKTLGARTVENGYKEAAIYENGKVVNGLGGGICQISTMLYNAAVFANLDIVERQNHMFIPSYAKAGSDATVVYGSIDFKFKNTRKYPIKIVATTNSGIARISIYGIYEENKYTVEFETEVLDIIPYETVYITDDSLRKGEEKVIQNGQNGAKVETYKVVKYGDAIISKTLLSTDNYRPMEETILKGR